MARVEARKTGRAGSRPKRVVFIFPLLEARLPVTYVNGIKLSETWRAVVDEDGYKLNAMAYIVAPDLHTKLGYKGKPELVVVTEDEREFIAEDFDEIFWVYDGDEEIVDLYEYEYGG